ncbi:MAG TPA: hypothetical protein VG013_17560 [Gemmataceae bacterium]|jgi:hypothetical protein|nr:hypothetical protein [Gemmataceae bacterium]
MKGVYVTLHLFAKPGRGPKEGAAVTAEQVRALAGHMAAWLQEVAKIADAMEKDRWGLAMGLHELHFSHAEIETEAEAQARIRNLGLPLSDFHIEAWEDDETEGLAL